MFTVELCEQDTGRQEAEAYQCSLSALLLPYPRIAACFDSSYIIGSGVCARKIQKEPVVFLHGVEKVTLDGRTPSNSRLIPYNSHWLADRTLAPLEAHGSGGGGLSVLRNGMSEIVLAAQSGECATRSNTGWPVGSVQMQDSDSITIGILGEPRCTWRIPSHHTYRGLESPVAIQGGGHRSPMMVL